MTPTLKPGVKVVVTQGLAVGIEAVVVGRFSQHFGRSSGPAMWRIQSNDLVRDRVLRADWLKVIS